MEIRNHTDLLNYLAETFNLQSYLEIGVQNPFNNLFRINCFRKVGVDPAIEPHHQQTRNVYNDTFSISSDEFFLSNKEKFDLIFIDGLHHADQVKRDFENSLKCLTDNGFIVIHDTLPTDEKYTHVPRDSKIWFGDVYKFAMNLIEYRGIIFCTLDIDCGCTVVYKGRETIGIPYKWQHAQYPWWFFEQHKDTQLRIVGENGFFELIELIKNDRLHSTIQ